LEGNGRGVIELLFWDLPEGTVKKVRKNLCEGRLSQPRFKPGTSRIEVYSVSAVNLLGSWCPQNNFP
jgi:hypothetical protein